MRIACWITKATKTLRICTIYCFTTTMVARTRLNVTLYVHWLSTAPSNAGSDDVTQNGRGA